MLEKYQNGKTAETTTSKLFDFAGTNVYDVKRFKISRVSNFTILTLIYFFASIELCKEKKIKLFMSLIMTRFYHELLPNERKLQVSTKVQPAH